MKNDNLTVQGNEEQLTVQFKKSQRRYTISNAGNVTGSNEKTLVLPEVGTITYEEGMTWEQWCNSKYNTYGIFIGYVAEYWGRYCVCYNGQELCVVLSDFEHGIDPGSHYPVLASEIVGIPGAMSNCWPCETGGVSGYHWQENNNIS